MPPTFGGTQRLPRLAGRKRALELLLTGEPFAPSRALEIGLVNSVVPHDDLLPAARDLAARIIRHSPMAIGGIITAVTRGLNMGIAEGLQVESEQFARHGAEPRPRRRPRRLDRAPAAGLQWTVSGAQFVLRSPDGVIGRREAPSRSRNPGPV